MRRVCDRPARPASGEHPIFASRQSRSPCSIAKRAAAARDETPIFRYRFSTWRPTVFGEMNRRSATSRFDRPRAIRRSTSTSRSVRSAGHRGGEGAARWPAAASTQATASASRLPRPRLERAGGVVLRERGAVRPVGGESGEHVRRGQDPIAARLGLGRERAVVPGPVEALVVGRRRLDEGRERTAPGEDPLGVVGVEPHPLPLRGRERTRLVPDPVLDGDPAEVVNEPRPPQVVARRVVEPGEAAGLLGERGDPAGMAADPGRLEVGEVGEGGEDRIEPVRPDGGHGLRLARQRGLPLVPAVERGEDVGSYPLEGLDDGGS